MAGFTVGDDDELISDINITPFVDVVLVLLIIFMVTTNFIVKAAIEVELPKAASGSSIQKPTLSITAECSGPEAAPCSERKLYVNGDVIAPAQDQSDLEILRGIVEQRVEKAIAECDDQEKPEETCGTQALITADANMRYAEVVQVIDAVKLGKASSFALNSEMFTEEGAE